MGILFVFLSNANVRFAKKELEWRKYTITKALATKKKVKLINYKKFAIAALDPNEGAFVVYMLYKRYKIWCNYLIEFRLVCSLPTKYQ